MVLCGLGVCGLMSVVQVASAQTKPARASYDERWRVFKPGSGTKEVDPNVYAYSPEFAKRFQMPAEWISTELKGADAVAFRITPTYASCGWGGDPKACRTDEVTCYVDVYFDHQRNPLPWDERYPEVMADANKYSSHFIPAPPRVSRLPRRADDISFAWYSPLVDPKTGKGLGWQNFIKGATNGGWTALLSYDKQIFSGMSLLTLLTSCDTPYDELWLTSGHIYTKDIAVSPQLNRRVELPMSWQIRVQQAMQETSELSQAFFKREGEKAMKALREPTASHK